MKAQATQLGQDQHQLFYRDSGSSAAFDPKHNHRLVLPRGRRLPAWPVAQTVCLRSQTHVWDINRTIRIEDVPGMFRIEFIEVAILGVQEVPTK